jgi:hypothetical protein
MVASSSDAMGRNARGQRAARHPKKPAQRLLGTVERDAMKTRYAAANGWNLIRIDEVGQRDRRARGRGDPPPRRPGDHGSVTGCPTNLSGAVRSATSTVASPSMTVRFRPILSKGS